MNFPSLLRMLSPFSLFVISLWLFTKVSGSIQHVIADPRTSLNMIPFSTRAYWMRQANIALGSPCPFAAFGSVIVNHTVPGLGELICTGVNSKSTGDPTLHGKRSLCSCYLFAYHVLIGEIVAIRNCSAILTDPSGPHNLTSSQALTAFSQLSLYTNAESCPMVRLPPPPLIAGANSVYASVHPLSDGPASVSTFSAPASRHS